MKIGYICVGSLLQHYGIEGGAIHIQEVCLALQKLGHDVFLIAGKRPLISKKIKVYELSIPALLPFARLRQSIKAFVARVYHFFRTKIPLSSLEYRPVDSKDSKPDFIKLSWSPIVFWNDIRTRVDQREYESYFYRQACRIIEGEQPDVLYERHVNYVGVMLSKRFGLPLILEMNGSNTFRREWRQRHSHLYPWMIRRWERRSCQEADAVTVVAPFLKQYLERIGILAEKIFVIPNGVDTNRFFPDDQASSDIRRKYGLDGKKIVGFVGGLRRYHGVDVLINCIRTVVKEIHDVHFLIVGDGPPRAALEKEARDLGVSAFLTYTGSVPYKDVPAFINAMDVTVSPFAKLPDFHFSPIKIFEYMAVSKPVIASRYPDTESSIDDHSNGLLVEPGDNHQLAEAILELLRDKNLRERLGKEGRRIVEKKYTWERNARKIMEIYEDLLQSGRP
jgi:glycosyltransferase involved in cell wall biosynthesis